MTIEGYADLDATDLASLIAHGELTALAVLEEAIERAERVNPQLNALVYPWYDHAKKRVREGLPKGPLHGVPFLLKDLFEDYEGQKQSNGCRALAGTVADHDAEMVIPCLSGCHPHPLYVWCGDKWLGRRTKRGWMFCSGKTFRLGLTYLA